MTKMRKRQAQVSAIKLDFADIKYLHEVVDWAHDNGVLDKKEHKRAARWVDKPWPSAWQSYKCGSRTGEEAWDEARLLTGAALKAFMRNDRRHVETVLVNHETIDDGTIEETEVLMEQKDKHGYKTEFFNNRSGMRIVSDKILRTDDASAHITYGQWDKFCQMTDAAADSGDWNAVRKHQSGDYYTNGAMVPAKPWLKPYSPHRYIPPRKDPWVQKPGAFQRIKARELAKEN